MVSYHIELIFIIALIMPPNSKKLRGAYWFDLVRLSVTLSYGHDILLYQKRAITKICSMD